MIGRIELGAEFGRERAQPVLSVSDPGAADVDSETGRKRRRFRASTDPVSRFKDDDRSTSSARRTRSRESREPCSDDTDIDPHEPIVTVRLRSVLGPTRYATFFR